jgi:hypothetical protein
MSRARSLDLRLDWAGERGANSRFCAIISNSRAISVQAKLVHARMCVRANKGRVCVRACWVIAWQAIELRADWPPGLETRTMRVLLPLSRCWSSLSGNQFAKTTTTTTESFGVGNCQLIVGGGGRRLVSHCVRPLLR